MNIKKKLRGKSNIVVWNILFSNKWSLILCVFGLVFLINLFEYKSLMILL